MVSTLGGLRSAASAPLVLGFVSGVSRRKHASLAVVGQPVQRLEPDRRDWQADPAGRRSRRATPDPTSRPSAGTRRPRSRHGRPQFADHRPGVNELPDPHRRPHRFIAGAQPAGMGDRHQRPPGQLAGEHHRARRRPHTPADRASRPGRRRGDRGSSSVTARRTSAAPQVGAAAASPACRRRPGQTARTPPRSATTNASQRIVPAQRATTTIRPGLDPRLWMARSRVEKAPLSTV